MRDKKYYKYLHAYYDKFQAEKEYDAERAEIYNSISPTRISYDHHSGKVFKMGCDPCDYAIQLHDIQRQHKQHLKVLEKRIAILEDAASLLYEDEYTQFQTFKHNPILLDRHVVKTLIQCLSYVLESNEKEADGTTMTVSEWDAITDAMSETELLEDYFDKDDTFDKDILRRRQLQVAYKVLKSSPTSKKLRECIDQIDNEV